MTDPLRTDAAHTGPLSDADREARIEQLLLSGLDHYFAGKYEQAINIWTRVAFLERGHGRARAYIERARSALAERQRESEELLHKGVEAYHAGDLQTARDLLTRAVDAGGVNETALALLQRLGSLEAASEAQPSEPAPRLTPAYVPRLGAASAGTRWAATIAVSAVIAAAILMSALPIASWLAELPVAAPPVEPRPVDPLPVVRRSELLLDRARQLYGSGDLREALRLLQEIDLADPLRPEADRLRASVQRALLAGVAPSRGGAAAGGAGR